MINKKRLAMMALAASMVLPNTFTPIFANEVEPMAETGNSGDTSVTPSPDPETPTGTDLLVSKLSESEKDNIDVLELASGEYTLDKDIENQTKPILITGTVKIDLGQYNISSSALRVFQIDGENAELHLTGTGKITSTHTGSDGFICLLRNKAKKLTIDSAVTLEEKTDKFIYGIGVGYHAPNTTVEVENAILNTTGGVYVDGLMDPKIVGPIITLNNVTVKTQKNGVSTDGGSAIYQAGRSKITVENSTFTCANSGFEIRAGEITVQNSVLNGGMDDPTTSKPNPAGSTGNHAGIVVAQHNHAEGAPAIKVDVQNSKVTGNMALAVTDPNNHQKDISDEFDPNITIDVKNSVLEGNTYDVGYTTNTIKFTLENTTLAKDEKPIKFVPGEKDVLVVDAEDKGPAPYILKTTKDTPTTLEVSKDDLDDLDIDSKLTSDGQLTPQGQETVKQILQKQVTQAENYAVLAPYNETQEVPLSYTYTVQKVDSTFNSLGEDGYNFSALVTATLKNENSIVRLMIPLLPTPEAGEVMTVKYETGEDENTASTDTFALDVKLSDVTGDDNKTLDPGAIKTVLDEKDDTDPTKPKYDPVALDSFGGITVDRDGAYIVDRPNLPIVITTEGVENKLYTENNQVITPTHSGGNKKPSKPAEEPMEPVVGTPTTMYRLYNRLTGEHLYTIDKNERDNLLTSDTWKDEGEGWIAPSVSDYPVYRLLNPNNGDHHYTTDKNEFDTLPSYGWIAEGVAFFSADKDNPENVLLHRLYNPNAQGAGSHHYTADTNERDALVAQGWKYEGLAWAGLPANK